MTAIFRHFSRAIACVSLALVVAVGTAQAQSAVPGAGYYVEEKMLVKDGKGEWFFTYWQTKVLPVFAAMPGYMGYTISTTIADPKLAAGEENFGPLLPLGPPDDVFIEHGGIQLRGTTTNTMIHFDSLLRGLLPLFGPNWTRLNGDADPWGTLEKDYFSNLENHWDTVYRVVGQDGTKIVSEARK